MDFPPFRGVDWQAAGTCYCWKTLLKIIYFILQKKLKSFLEISFDKDRAFKILNWPQGNITRVCLHEISAGRHQAAAFISFGCVIFFSFFFFPATAILMCAFSKRELLRWERVFQLRSDFVTLGSSNNERKGSTFCFFFCCFKLNSLLVMAVSHLHSTGWHLGWILLVSHIHHVSHNYLI